ncbi:LptA/OstA family protein [Terriglobus tenax]|uniref:LptA/OstA family protein n=1 Tax=Terriglobus tenax TaxID=1111115 RepID=UPI0021E0FA16|nr:LptA/OstA family protein [Terriglobus tenax]
MRITVERLRMWLLVGAGALLLLVAGYIGYARYRVGRFLQKLPQQLGVDISQSTNGFTYSQSVKGRTLFTVHAARAIQHKDGKVTLNDVSITVHDGDRTDRITSNEFLYDQSNGIIRADGEVLLDLQSPGGQKDQSGVHIKTSGLVFAQKLGVAATENPIEFSAKGVTGHATGADYSTDTGVLILHSAVDATMEAEGRQVKMFAGWAQLDRKGQVAQLKQARVVQQDSVAQVAEALIYLRRDGSAERIETSGGLKVTSTDGRLLTAQRSQTWLTARSQPQRAHLLGAVHMEQAADGRVSHGDAAEALVEFDGAGNAKTAHLEGGVHLTDEEGKKGARDLRAAKLDLNFELVEKKAVLRQAVAHGDASVLSTANGTRSQFWAETLTAQFAGTTQLHASQMHGEGHARMDSLSAKGVRQSASSDRMDVALNAANEIDTGTMTGAAVITQSGITRGKPHETQATGERAELKKDGLVELTGHPRIRDNDGTVDADRIQMQRQTQQAWAIGTVKATYNRGTDPMHLVADRAEWRPQDDTAIFTGTSRPARMWQAQSQVEAPEIRLDRAKQAAIASAGSGAVVHAVLVSAATPKHPSAVYRITARQMDFSETQHQVEFTGPVRMDSADGHIAARQATVYLAAAKAKNSDFSGSVERVVAREDVVIEQGQRRGTGGQLVYTAADGLAVLTGSPKVVDPEQGTITGAQLSFHAGDGSVVVTGATDRRVRTETQVK